MLYTESIVFICKFQSSDEWKLSMSGKYNSAICNKSYLIKMENLLLKDENQTHLIEGLIRL